MLVPWMHYDSSTYFILYWNLCSSFIGFIWFPLIRWFEERCFLFLPQLKHFFIFFSLSYFVGLLLSHIWDTFFNWGNSWIHGVLSFVTKFNMIAYPAWLHVQHYCISEILTSSWNFQDVILHRICNPKLCVSPLSASSSHLMLDSTLCCSLNQYWF